jgi:hypothetical protein
MNFVYLLLIAPNHCLLIFIFHMAFKGIFTVLSSYSDDKFIACKILLLLLLSLQ